MYITYDSEADAAYIRLDVDSTNFADSNVFIDDEKLSGYVVLDISAAGRLLGIEITNAKEILPPEALAAARPPDPS